MCKYCKVLAELRFKDLHSYQRTIEKYKQWFKEDDLLLRRCLIALPWNENEQLVQDILEQIDKGGEKNV